MTRGGKRKTIKYWNKIEVELGKWHELRVEAKGSTFKVWLNDTFVGEVKDAAKTSVSIEPRFSRSVRMVLIHCVRASVACLCKVGRMRWAGVLRRSMGSVPALWMQNWSSIVAAV